MTDVKPKPGSTDDESDVKRPTLTEKPKDKKPKEETEKPKTEGENNG